MFSSWIIEIISGLNVSNDEQTKIENAYYAPRLERILIVILTRISLWSNIMVRKSMRNQLWIGIVFQRIKTLDRYN